MRWLDACLAAGEKNRSKPLWAKLLIMKIVSHGDTVLNVAESCALGRAMAETKYLILA
jgi:hypothetical protein